MSHLDDELRTALHESEARQSETRESAEQAGVVQDVPGAPAVSAAGAAGPPRRNLALLGGVLVAALGILTLVFSSVDEAAIYSMTTDKLLAQKDEFSGKNVRVEGNLVPGTLTRRDQPCEYRFSIQKNDIKLAVRYPQCVVPDTFKDVPGMDVQVTAEGKLNPDGHFDATNIMAKCPSKYEMQQRAKKGEAAPHVMGAAGPLEAVPAVPAGTMEVK
jgi:cytochrome c-type biogenesis protein CcmE